MEGASSKGSKTQYLLPVSVANSRTKDFSRIVAAPAAVSSHGQANSIDDGQAKLPTAWRGNAPVSSSSGSGEAQPGEVDPAALIAPPAGVEDGLKEDLGSTHVDANACITGRTQVQMHGSSDGAAGKEATAAVNKQSAAAAKGTVSPQQNAGATKSKQKVAVSAVAGANVTDGNVTDIPLTLGASQPSVSSREASQGRSSEEVEVISLGADPSASNSVDRPVRAPAALAPAALMDTKNVSQQTKGAETEVPVNAKAEQQGSTQKPEAEVEKRTEVPAFSGVDAEAVKREGSAATILSHVESDRVAGASALVSVPAIHTEVSGRELDQRLHSGESATHTTGLQAGFEELSGGVSASIHFAPKMLTATPTALEVGVQSETHGWLKVRAELTEGGAVNASVSATSSASQASLHAELPGLTAYLQEEKVAVNAIVIHSSMAFGAESGGFAGTGGGENGSAPSGRDQGGRREQGLGDTGVERGGGAIYEEWSSSNGEDLSSTLSGFQGRSWLSVRA